MILDETEKLPPAVRFAGLSPANFYEPCPDPEAVVVFALGLLSPRDSAALALHLEMCDRCRVEVEALRAALEVSFGPPARRGTASAP
jgi:hypothetical protein